MWSDGLTKPQPNGGNFDINEATANLVLEGYNQGFRDAIRTMRAFADGQLLGMTRQEASPADMNRIGTQAAQQTKSYYEMLKERAARAGSSEGQRRI